MKLGSFVGKETISLDKNETTSCIQLIKEFVEKNFDFIDNTFEIIETEQKLKIKVNFTDNKTRIDDEKNTYLPKYIYIDLIKQKGYDNKVGYDKDKGYDLISYSSNIYLIGLFRRYRCKNIESYVGLLPTSYQYGTEINDIDFCKALKRIAKYLSYSWFAKKPLVIKEPHCLNYID